MGHESRDIEQVTALIRSKLLPAFIRDRPTTDWTSMNRHPLITIGMPVYNCEQTVAEAIASILNQTFKDWELVVYDDGSRDRTLAVVHKFADRRISVVEGGVNRTLPVCLNRIVAASRSDLFARMDADDIAYPDRLQRQLKAMEQHPEADLLGGSILIFDRTYQARGLRQAAEAHADICSPAWRLSLLPHVTWIGRTSWFRQHPYRESSSHAQDRDLLVRVWRESIFAGLTEVLVGVRELAPEWKKLLRARKQFLDTTIREGAAQRNPSLLFITSTAEVVKLGLDALAISTGLNYRLLRHRLPPVPPGMAAEWNVVLKKTIDRVQSEIGLSPEFALGVNMRP